MKGIASVLASHGRGEDSMLVHMTPKEVGALQGLASLQGGSLTVNPTTGLPEAGILGKLLPTLAGAAAAYFSGGAAAPLLGSVGADAAAAGAATGLLQHGNLQGAITGGLGGLAGGSLLGLTGLGAGALTAEELAAQQAGTDLWASEGVGGNAINSGMTQLPAPMATDVALAGTPPEATGREFAKLGDFPGINGAAPAPTVGPTASNIVAASPSANAIGQGVQQIRTPGALGGGFNGKDFLGNFMATDPVTGKIAGIKPLGAVAGIGGALYLGDRANRAARKLEEERFNRSYVPGSAYFNQQSQPYPTTHWAQGGITGLYPNRSPEREVVGNDGGNETAVDPFTGQPQNNTGMAGGGVAGQPRYLRGAGDGMSDSIPAHIEGQQPAALANSEFVVPADVVSHLGNGSSEAGAKQLYAMMDRIRKARTGHTKQGKQINAAKLLPA